MQLHPVETADVCESCATSEPLYHRINVKFRHHLRRLEEEAVQEPGQCALRRRSRTLAQWHLAGPERRGEWSTSTENERRLPPGMRKLHDCDRAHSFGAEFRFCGVPIAAMDCAREFCERPDRTRGHVGGDDHVAPKREMRR